MKQPGKFTGLFFLSGFGSYTFLYTGIFPLEKFTGSYGGMSPNFSFTCIK